MTIDKICMFLSWLQNSGQPFFDPTNDKLMFLSLVIEKDKSIRKGMCQQGKSDLYACITNI